MMPDTFIGNRIEEWSWRLLDARDRPIRPLSNVKDGRVEQNVNAVIRGGGSVTIQGDPLDWGRNRVQPWVTVNGTSWPVGVFLFASPMEKNSDTGRFFDVGLLDKLSIMDADKLANTYSVAAGFLVTNVIEDLIHEVGETNISVTPSSLTTRSQIVWPAGTSRLRIINDLLDSINYFSLWVDGYGTYRVEPYLRPSQRAITRSFERGKTAIHRSSWTRDQDTASVPNRVVMTSQSTEDDLVLVGVAENRNESSPYSYPSRGYRWVTHVEDGVEAASREVLNDLAQQKLAALSNPVTTVQVEHAIIPFNLNDVVLFQNMRHVVAGYSITTRPGSLVSATWKQATDE